LRRDSTDAERILWDELRSRRFAGFKFRRQQPIGPYILDFFCREPALAIELDGGQHSNDDAKAYDRQRREYLRSMGVAELRFWNDELTRNLEGVLRKIADTLNSVSEESSADIERQGWVKK
jgi:very-short-patch-repair endonuclease